MRHAMEAACLSAANPKEFRNSIGVGADSPRKLNRTWVGPPTIARVAACEFQPPGIVRLSAWVIARVGAQRRFHIVSDAKGATNCGGGATLYAFAFLSATKLPFPLARYLQIR